MLRAISSHINSEFGSRRALLSTVRFELVGMVGGFSQYRRVDWSRVERLVFVCMGNICRSPLAEAVAERWGVKVISAGVACDGGHPADSRAIAFGARYGLDLQSHRSLPIHKVELTQGDLVVGMEPQHLAVPALRERSQAQQTLLGLWGRPRKIYIHDPFNTSHDYFDRCERYVVDSTKSLLTAWGRSELASGIVGGD